MAHLEIFFAAYCTVDKPRCKTYFPLLIAYWKLYSPALYQFQIPIENIRAAWANGIGSVDNPATLCRKASRFGCPVNTVGRVKSRALRIRETKQHPRYNFPSVSRRQRRTGKRIFPRAPGKIIFHVSHTPR